jgi:intracellular sulfur oxidation DsrE/DsrF family protein
MKKIGLAVISCIASMLSIAQSNSVNLSKTKDSTLKAMIHADSLKIDSKFAEKERWANLFAKEEFPVINAGKYSGVFPVKDITEVPDPKMQYKLLYEMTQENSDSALNEPDYSLVEIARLINLHVGSGIPLKNISVVVVTHGPALHSISTDKAYQLKFKMNNPNLKLIKDLEKAGVRFIACGQSMLFLNVKEEDLVPEVKISLTAQSALTGYQLKGYVLKSLDPKKR